MKNSNLRWSAEAISSPSSWRSYKPGCFTLWPVPKLSFSSFTNSGNTSERSSFRLPLLRAPIPHPALHFPCGSPDAVASGIIPSCHGGPAEVFEIRSLQLASRNFFDFVHPARYASVLISLACQENLSLRQSMAMSAPSAIGYPRPPFPSSSSSPSVQQR